MGHRYTFKCWNCQRDYTLFREITDQQTLAVACPYCYADGVVDLQPFRKENKVVLLRGEAEKDQPRIVELQLPEIIPTQKPD